MTSQRTINGFQIFIGAVVLLLAAATVAQTTYVQGQIDNQRSCLADAFAAQNDAIQARGKIGAQESALTRNAMLAFSDAAEHPKADNQKELIAALLKYKADISHLTKRRARTPIPDFPKGACE